jgi:hypothetical protein
MPLLKIIILLCANDACLGDPVVDSEHVILVIFWTNNK